MVTRSTKALLREAIQSFVSGRLVIVGLILMAASFTAVALIGETISAERARAADIEFRQLGGNLRLIEENAEEPGSVVSRQVCDGLSQLWGVEAAGSVGEPYFRRLSAYGDRQLQVFPSSPGMGGVLESVGQLHTDNALVMSDDAVESLGFGGRDTVLLTEEGAVVSVSFAIADLEPLRPGYDRGALAVVPPVGGATTCFVAMRPTAVDLAESLPAAFGEPDLVVTPALIGSDLVTTGAELWDERTTKSLWLIGTVSFALVLGIVSWVRRSDSALYRVLGLQYSDIAAIRLVETSMASLSGSLVGALAATSALWTDYSQVLPFGLIAAGLTSAGQLLACWLQSAVLWAPNPIDQLKDR